MRSLSYILVIFVAVLCSCSNQSLQDRLKQNAKELLNLPDSLEFTSNTNSPTKDIVNIGSGLFKVLQSRTVPTNSIDIEIHNGDLFSEGQGVSHSIKYVVQGSDNELILRIRYDKSRDQFHIVGYTGKLE